MICEICRNEIAEGDIVCSSCGAPITQTAVGFDNAVEIQHILRSLIVENFSDRPVNTRSLVALIRDYLADYKTERRLLIYAINSGVLKNMVAESDHKIAVMRARSFLLNECFITEEAAEFVLICLTYMLKWPYKSSCAAKTPKPDVPVDTVSSAESFTSGSSVQLDVNAKIFRTIDAVKYKLSRNIDIQKKYTKIEGFAFDRSGMLRTVKLPDTLIAIGEYAFSGCKHLKLIEIPDSLRIIGQGAFSQCSELTDIYIPHGVLEIEDNTFLCCESLESVSLPETVSSIGVQAFSGCEALKMLKIPESVKFIDDNAFLCCPSLTIRCYENSYAHKYCLAKNIRFETVMIGMDL